MIIRTLRNALWGSDHQQVVVRTSREGPDLQIIETVRSPGKVAIIVKEGKSK